MESHSNTSEKTTNSIVQQIIQQKNRATKKSKHFCIMQQISIDELLVISFFGLLALPEINTKINPHKFTKSSP